MQPAPSVLKTNRRGTTSKPSLESTGTAPACDPGAKANRGHVPATVIAGGEHAPTRTVRACLKIQRGPLSIFRQALRNVLVAAVVIIGLSGCTSFHRDWRKAAATPGPAAGIEGRWQGSWVSGVNGHHGRLRCLVSRLDRGQYQARFHAKYQKIFSFGYTASLAVEEHNGLFRFRGEADLGRLAGGKYQYEGTATATNYSSTYRSKYDYGTFQMVRP